jgi:L-ribulose-5-phosphate 4-epimerase
MTPSDVDVRATLALGCRILAANGHDDLIYGHVSARSGERDALWMKARGIGLDEVTPDRLVLLDPDGEVIGGEGPRHAEYPIHAAVLQARPDVNAVVHTHPRHAIALGARGETIQPISHEGACFVPEGVPLFDEFTSLVTSMDQGRSVAERLGRAQALILVNHGIVTTGASVAEACYAALMLERAAAIQLLGLGGGGVTLRTSSRSDAALKKQTLWDPKSIAAVFDYLARRLDA